MSQTLEPSGFEKQTTIPLSIFISWAKLRRKNSQEMQWGHEERNVISTSYKNEINETGKNMSVYEVKRKGI